MAHFDPVSYWALSGPHAVGPVLMYAVEYVRSEVCMWVVNNNSPQCTVCSGTDTENNCAFSKRRMVWTGFCECLCSEFYVTKENFVKRGF